MSGNGSRKPASKDIWALVVCGDAQEFQKATKIRTILLEMPPDEFEEILTRVKSAPDGEEIIFSFVKRGIL